MAYLKTSIRRGGRTPALCVFSHRFWEWIVTAVAVIVFTIIAYPTFVDRPQLWACCSAVACTIFGYGITRLYRIAATFAFCIHTIAFEEAKAIAHGKQRREWYARVARWLETNRLVGKNVNRFWWNSSDRRCFAATFESLLRSARGRPHACELDSDLSPDQKWTSNELHDQIEEIPPLAQALFYRDCYRVLIFCKTLQISVLLSIGTAVLHLLVTNEPFPTP